MRWQNNWQYTKIIKWAKYIQYLTWPLLVLCQKLKYRIIWIHRFHHSNILCFHCFLLYDFVHINTIHIFIFFLKIVYSLLYPNFAPFLCRIHSLISTHMSGFFSHHSCSACSYYQLNSVTHFSPFNSKL